MSLSQPTNPGPSFRPRASRDQSRGRTAAAHVRATGGSAMDQALAAIDAEFGEAGKINSFKRRVEALIRKSYGHAEVRARFEHQAAFFIRHSITLDQACLAAAIDRRVPHPGERVALPGMVRDEIHLILRWMRFMRMHKAFAEMIEAERAALPALEAAE